MKLKFIILTALLLQILLFAQEQTDYQLMVKSGRAANYTKAIEYGLKVVEKEESSYLKLLLATYYSMDKQIEPALEWLNIAVEEGEIDYRMIMTRPDFENIKQTERFAEIVEKAKSSLLDQMEEKRIELEEGKWSQIEFEFDDEYPQIDISLKYDLYKLEIKAKVNDLHFKDGFRSWRYGDGFFINLVTPDNKFEGYSDKFYSYGFSLTKGNPVAVLVNKDGNYKLKNEYDLLPDIQINNNKNKADYHIKIPWSKLYPTQPLLNEEFGINIIYISRNDDGSRKILRYVHDYFYDTENTDFRKYAPITFKTSEYTLEQIKGEIDNRLIDSDELTINLAAYLKYENEGTVNFKILNESNEEVYSKTKKYDFRAGKNTSTHKIFFDQPEGYYKVRVVLNNKSIWEDTFYKYPDEKIKKIKTNLAEKYKSENVIQINSLDAVSYRIQELEKSIKNYSNRNDPVKIETEFEKISKLYEILNKENSVFVNDGYLLAGFKSTVDSSLQPYSIYLPENFDPEKEYNLFVGLHGSGVNEVNFIKATAKAFENSNGIIIAPRGRGLSDWYLGKTEQDVLDLISKISEMYNIKKKLIYGFSMGGYGVWRMTHLYPKLFDSAIEICGLPTSWIGDPEKDDMNNYVGAAKDINFLVISGVEDKGVPIKKVEDFVAKLKNAGYSLDYEPVEGGGHGNFDFTSIIKEWLKDNF